jgi:hypothetical protein
MGRFSRRGIQHYRLEITKFWTSASLADSVTKSTVAYEREK